MEGMKGRYVVGKGIDVRLCGFMVRLKWRAIVLSADSSELPYPAENWYSVETMSFLDELCSNEFTGP